MTESDPLLVERGSTHGDYTEQASLSVTLRSLLQTGASARRLTAVQTDAITMICVKLSRIVNGDPNFKDHWRDIAGYAKLAEDRCEPKK